MILRFMAMVVVRKKVEKIMMMVCVSAIGIKMKERMRG